MRASDTLRFSQTSLRSSPGRTLLILLAMAIGVASVIILTSLGEGARLYVTGEFRSMGSNLLLVLPGRNETTGGLPPMLGTTPRDLTIEDSQALGRIPGVVAVGPLAVGGAMVSFGSLEREVTVLGTTPQLSTVMDLEIQNGRFLPEGDPRDATAHCVLGHTLAAELFPYTSPLGQWLRVGERRFRVVGVLKKRDQKIPVDMSDTVMIPVASAQSLFNQPSLFRIAIKVRDKEKIASVKKRMLATIRQRHDGEEDITVVAQDALIGTFDSILKTLTYAVAGIAAISLLVAGILIMNVMMVSVSQRRAEIGLLKALGASTRQVLQLFLAEALMLSLLGGLVGLAIGYAAAASIDQFIPGFNVVTPMWAWLAALLVTLMTGLVFGSVPAKQAAQLDPVRALSGR